MKIKVTSPDLCTFCHNEVFKDTFGWGYMFVGTLMLYFHTECVEVESELDII